MNKILLKFVFALIAIVLLGVFVVSCDNKDKATPQTTSEVATDGNENTTKTDGYLNIFDKDSGYVCAFVLPKDATEGEREVAVALKKELKKKTGRDTKFVYDDDEKLDKSQNLILIGNTNFEESKAVYSTLKARQSVAKITGNKLIIAFDNISSGMKTVDKIASELSACDKNDVKIKLDWSVTLMSRPNKEDLPIYEKSNLKTTDLSRDSKLMTSMYNKYDDFKAYCDKISEAGFDRVETKESNGHMFVTFMGESDYVYAYFIKDHSDFTGVGTISVVSGPQESFSMGDFSDGLEEKYTPNISIIGQNRSEKAGQGYIFKLPDGRFIVYDGGFPDAVYKIFDTLKSQAVDPNNIVVAAWFISHPHDDHQSAIERFLELYSTDKTVKIQSAIFNYAAPEDYVAVEDANGDDRSDWVINLYKKLEQYSPDTKLIKAHTGQTFKFGSFEAEILYTIEDYLPSKLDYINSSSMVVRFNIGGQKILMLADIMTRAAPIVQNMWKDYLKSDVVQLAHHGMWAGTEEIYEYIRPDIILWPTQLYGAKDMLATDWYNATIIKALSYAKDVYVSGDTVTVMDLPLKIQNNKEDVLIAINEATK